MTPPPQQHEAADLPRRGPRVVVAAQNVGALSSEACWVRFVRPLPSTATR